MGSVYKIPVEDSDLIYEIVRGCRQSYDIGRTIQNIAQVKGLRQWDVLLALEFESLDRCYGLRKRGRVDPEDDIWPTHALLRGGRRGFRGHITPHTAAVRSVAIENILRYTLGFATMIDDPADIRLPLEIVREARDFLQSYGFTRDYLARKLLGFDEHCDDPLLQEALGIVKRDNYLNLFPEAQSDYRTFSDEELAWLGLQLHYTIK